MTKRTPLRHLVEAGIVLCVALASISASAQAAGPARHGGKPATRCKTRTQATGTIKFSNWQFPDTLNPNQTALGVSWEVIYGFMDSLFIFDSKGHVAPQMATEIPTVKNGGIKNGGKTVVVHLRQGLRWSDGTPITAADIAFGWKVGMDPDSGPWCGGSCDEIVKIDTPNKYTSVWHLKEVYAAAIPYAAPFIWPRKWAGAWNNDAHAAADKLFQDPTFTFEGPNYPTNGAYQVSQFVQDDRVVLHPMKYYNTLNCGASVKNLIFEFFSSKEGMLAGAATRATDITENYTIADLPALKAHHKAFKVHVDPQFQFEHLEFNVDRTYHGNPNPLNQSKVRLALALALDKSGLIQGALGVPAKQVSAIEAWSPLVATPHLVQQYADKKLNGQWDPLQKRYDANTGHGRALADAKELLSSTSFKHGFSLDLWTGTGNPLRDAEISIMQASWAKLGVQININQAPTNRLFADWDHAGTFSHGDFQIALFTNGGPGDPDSFKYFFQSQYVDRQARTHGQINANYSGIHDKILNRAFNTGAHSFSHKVRAAAYASFQRELNKQAYWIELYYRPGIATTDGKVTPFSNNPATDLQWNMYAWKVRTNS